MAFGSIEFLLKFLPIFLVCYYMVPGKWKRYILLVGSFFFYASAGLWQLFLLVGIGLANFGVGLWLSKKKQNAGKKNIVLGLGVAGNLLALGLFKVAPGMILPVGLSFYTFQNLAYLVDVWRGTTSGETSPLSYLVYLCMFSKVISGPITRYQDVVKEIEKPVCNGPAFDRGIKDFVVGLAFKVLLADRMALLWNEIQVTGFVSISTPLAWLGAVAYSMVIYFDFFGYSLMAIGLGEMLGIHLPENFSTPYMATSVREFYRRWHITLGKWFCTYVYIPLGGNRKGVLRTVLHLLVVWVLTALWHGTGFNFLIWGILLWTFISLEKVFATIGTILREKYFPRNAEKKQKNILLRGMGHVYVWLVIPITWMCFAIPEMDQLQTYLGRMFGLVDGIHVYVGDFAKALGNYGPLLLMCLFLCLPFGKKIYEKYKNSITGMVVLAIVFWYSVYQIVQEGTNPFLYLHF